MIKYYYILFLPVTGTRHIRDDKNHFYLGTLHAGKEFTAQLISTDDVCWGITTVKRCIMPPSVFTVGTVSLRFVAGTITAISISSSGDPQARNDIVAFSPSPAHPIAVNLAGDTRVILPNSPSNTKPEGRTGAME